MSEFRDGSPADVGGSHGNGLAIDFVAALDRLTDAVVLEDRQGRVLYANRAATALLGSMAPSSKGLGVRIASSHRAAFDAFRESALGAGALGDWASFDALRADGISRPLSISAVAVEERGEAVGLQYALREAIAATGSYLDAAETERKRSTRELAIQASYLHQLFTNSPQAIALLDPTDLVVSINHAFERLFGYSAEEAKGKRVNDLLGFRDVEEEAADLSRKAHGGEVVRLETVRRRKDGSEVDVEVLGYPIQANDEHIGAYAVYADISARKTVEQRLQHEATHDALTGLSNRARFLALIRRSLELQQRGDAPGFSVILVDLDRFKIVNDSVGHASGDRVLCDIASRLREIGGPNATVARLGGDEFGLLLDGVSEASGALTVADKIRRCLEEPLSLGPNQIILGGSLGIALSDATFVEAEHFLRNATIALYRAKATHKPYAFFTPEMHEASLARVQLESDLRQAIERKQFMLHYQPIVSLETGRITGVEALIRWPHPTRGMISPVQFIPVAEETRLVIPMTRWVLEEACGFMQRLRRDFPGDPLSVGVNLSTVEFADASIVTDIRRILERSGLPPGALAVEITESAMMENAEEAAAMLSALRSDGVAVHVDDFGTGYSSLAYLHRFPVDRLKVDRSFVSRMDADASNLGIVRAIITLAHDLGQRVVAEGVESASQMNVLRSIGCEYAQGYYLAKPVPEDALRALLASGRTF